MVILTTFDLDEYVYAALQAGASGFLLKDVTPEQLVAAVRTVSVGDALLAPSITRRLIGRFAHAVRPAALQPAQLKELTQRELDVLALMAEGASNKMIARQLNISVHTVKFHVGSLLDKLDATGRTDAVAHAARRGVIEL